MADFAPLVSPAPVPRAELLAALGNEPGVGGMPLPIAPSRAVAKRDERGAAAAAVATGTAGSGALPPLTGALSAGASAAAPSGVALPSLAQGAPAAPVRPGASVASDAASDAAQRAVAEALAQAAGAPLGPMSSFVASGGRFPVVLLTCNRPDMLRATLQSLLALPGLSPKYDVIVVQDGTDGAVKDVALSFGVHLKQNAGHAGLRGAANDGAARIAAHYKFALSYAFGARRDAPAIIVAEDDFLFSPDFFEYFEQNARALEMDPTLFVMSAWNDNGLRGNVRDRATLLRTGFFPGLGWLLPRRLYEDELERRWPSAHWDHWLRDPQQHKGRECLYPEVPRTYHAGKKGTFMDEYHHNRYFKNIDYNTDASFHWATGAAGETPTFVSALAPVYEAKLTAVLSAATTTHITSMTELSLIAVDAAATSAAASSAAAAPPDPPVVAVWYSISQRNFDPPPFQQISEFFGIWHEVQRADHNGLHQFFWRGVHVYLVDAAQSRYTKLRPAAAPPFKPNDFRKLPELDPAYVAALKTMRVVPAATAGLSCDAVCGAEALRCSKPLLSAVNTCAELQKAFPCAQGCTESLGGEQPAFVSPSAPAEYMPGTCLSTTNPAESTCESSHPVTLRLCPCVPR